MSPPPPAQPAWARETPVAGAARSSAASPSCSSATPSEIAAIVAAETGKSPKDALGETGGAIEMGYFVAGEGRRSTARTTTSAVPNRQAMTSASRSAWRA